LGNEEISKISLESFNNSFENDEKTRLSPKIEKQKEIILDTNSNEKTMTNKNFNFLGLIQTDNLEGEFRKRFTETELHDEVPKNYFFCALQKKKFLFLQGVMYISDNYVCFYSHLNKLYKPTKKIIALKDIIELRKTNTIMIPNSIQIIYQTSDGKELIDFSSFLHRDEAYNMIYDLWLDKKQLFQPLSTIQEGKDIELNDVSIMNEQFHRRFSEKIAKNENLVYVFKCEYEGYHGTFYLTNKGGYFYSERFGIATMRVFPFDWISCITGDYMYDTEVIVIQEKEESQQQPVFILLVSKNRDKALQIFQQLFESYKPDNQSSRKSISKEGLIRKSVSYDRIHNKYSSMCCSII
jgi:hypothetical protein